MKNMGGNGGITKKKIRTVKRRKVFRDVMKKKGSVAPEKEGGGAALLRDKTVRLPSNHHQKREEKIKGQGEIATN